MTEKIVASNGWELREDGAIYSNPTARHRVISRGGTEALREMFQRERDEELGRWRERPECGLVVYPNGSDEFGNRCVRVLWESTGTDILIWENKIPGTLFGDAARNYFAEHPVKKPWHDARHLEIWALTIQGCPSEAYIYREGYPNREPAFRPVNNEDRVRFAPTDPKIVDAHRIWPEGDNE